jgi:hypothetical protein
LALSESVGSTPLRLSQTTCVFVLRVAVRAHDCCALNVVGYVCLQDQVSSTNSYPILGDVFKHGQVVTARIFSTDIGDRAEQAQEGAKRK